MGLRNDNPCDRVMPVLGPQDDIVVGGNRLVLPMRGARPIATSTLPRILRQQGDRRRAAWLAAVVQGLICRENGPSAWARELSNPAAALRPDASSARAVDKANAILALHCCLLSGQYEDFRVDRAGNSRA
ncbi:MAG: hypothetical protein OXD30_11655 [Bryobacterales bacterium]|nr:hypothetical protein [Bryobacterales bacterium]